MTKYTLVPLAAIVLLAACDDNSTHEQTSPPAAAVGEMQLPVTSDDTPDFLPKDMSWMPADIWLPEDFEPRQSQKMSPAGDTYTLRGITQMSGAALAETFSAKMVAANYEPFGDPKPGRLMFRGNGHGLIVSTISEAGTDRELVISVENASGR